LYGWPFTVIVAPAEAEAVIVPLAKPKQLTFVEVADIVTWIGWLMVTEVDAVHPSTVPLLSDTVTV
jgi:uncharacterized membrane protein (DUF106 family)